MKKLISVAIDGPAGAGKSSIAKAVSKKFGFIHVDTGALYRTIALHLFNNKISADDETSIANELPKVNLDFSVVNGQQVIKLFGEDVAAKIRTPEISMIASKIATQKEVRDFLLDFQRDVAKKYNVVMDGRDVGTVILPKATVKIFLTASSEERAKRRFIELNAKEKNVSYDEILEQVKKRDHNDSNRKIAPLKKASDAVMVDSSNMTEQETIKFVISIIEKTI